MGKSSLKKRPSKSRTRKRGKTSSKRSKSKKFRRRALSLSHSDHTGSTTSSMSLSSSSSEDYYSSRRSRSLARRDGKGSKKRAKRRSASSDGSEEVHRRRKRRGSKRRKEEDRARKSVRQGRKKRRRDVSVSSTNSESWSCSTCQDSGSGDGSEFDRKTLGKVRNGKKKGRTRSRNFSSSMATDSSGYHSQETKVNNTRQVTYATPIVGQDERASPLNIGNSTVKSRRSRSHSPHSRSIDSCGYKSEERLMKVTNVRRLRSVITVVRHEEKVGTSESGDLKEEVECDENGSRNNETNGTGNRKDLTNHSNVLSESKRRADDGQGRTIMTSDLDTTSGVKEICIGDGGYEKGDFEKGRETEVSISVGSLNGDDLESILRQRALENLRKFRGRKQTNVDVSATQEDKKDSALKKPYSSENESFQTSCKESGGVVTTGQESEQLRQPIARKGAPGSMPSNSQKTPDEDGISQELGSPLLEVSSLGKVPVEDPKEKIKAAVDAGPNEIPTPSFGERSRAMCSKSEHIPAVQESSQANLAPGGAGKERASGTAETDVSDKVNKVPDSDSMHTTPVSASGDIRSEKLQNETKESSQFEQKTMSVMRGGELVQVNYKVYIPKKAPALARRQLKR